MMTETTRQLYQALVVAQDIAIRASNTPPSSDPRWVLIANAIHDAHQGTCSFYDGGPCNCGLDTTP